MGPEPRVDWSRRAGKSWELNPVLLHRRQAGQPQRPDDDLITQESGAMALTATGEQVVFVIFGACTPL